MIKNEITDLNEQLGRDQFTDYVSKKQPDWNITRYATKRFDKWDVAFTTGTTEDFVIGEIKHRYKDYDAFDTWYLEQDKFDNLQDIKTRLQKKYPNKKIFIHYINFYWDKKNIPRIWDITNLQPDYTIEQLPNNSNTSTAYKKPKSTAQLHNNTTINH
ncbi:hypothetical protein GKZ90_0021145 [Flavobacterium sp. MC2016-06]|uniref:hypothetical protein n=1 Tax=Flavobacterium sp. MC2016-06 TaxID=2676308 RepID=UPI0012BAE00D|nr:hypothetical protein [Flavobacterium sp. MC2016-06]MBU3861008.1 hypothetical protein [Flavobacterium sp. MC2016-06]